MDEKSKIPTDKILEDVKNGLVDMIKNKLVESTAIELIRWISLIMTHEIQNSAIIINSRLDLLYTSPTRRCEVIKDSDAHCDQRNDVFWLTSIFAAIPWKSFAFALLYIVGILDGAN